MDVIVQIFAGLDKIAEKSFQSKEEAFHFAKELVALGYQVKVI